MYHDPRPASRRDCSIGRARALPIRQATHALCPKMGFGLALGLALGLGLLAPRPAAATTAEDIVSAEVLPGWRNPQGSHMAALRLQLAPGWKTYWRSPGEAGIPPRFDWSGSQNIKSFTLHWPTPALFTTNGLQTIGYHDQLILPVELTPRDPAQPMLLALRMDLGVCSDICVPASLELSHEITGAGAPDPRITTALRARPRSGKEAKLTSIQCNIEPIKDGLRLTAEIAMPAQGKVETVAIETKDPTIWVSEVSERRQAGRLIAVSELVPPQAQPFGLDRSGITVTILSEQGAVEVHGCPG